MASAQRAPGRDSAQRDRQRDNLLEADGWHILRFNTEEVQQELPAVVTRVRKAINRCGGIEEETGEVGGLTEQGDRHRMRA